MFVRLLFTLSLRIFRLFGDFTIMGDWLQKIRSLFGAHGLWAGREFYRVIPALAQGLGFCGLITKDHSSPLQTRESHLLILICISMEKLGVKGVE